MQIASKLSAWTRLVRIEHAIMSAFGVIVGILLGLKTGGSIDEINFLLAIMVPISINIGAFALNDYWDIETDKSNKQTKRPLVSGELSIETAIISGIVGLILGSLFGVLINPLSGIIAIIFAVFSVLYNWKLKDIAIFGNMFIAISMAIAFLFGAFATGLGVDSISPIIWILAIGGGFAGFGREIVKTVQDMHGDKKIRGSKSLPHIIGKRKSLIVAGICFALFIISVLAMMIYSTEIMWNVLSIGLLMISVITYTMMAIIITKKDVSDKEIERIRKASLYALMIALIGIFIILI